MGPGDSFKICSSSHPSSLSSTVAGNTSQPKQRSRFLMETSCEGNRTQPFLSRTGPASLCFGFGHGDLSSALLAVVVCWQCRCLPLEQLCCFAGPPDAESRPIARALDAFVSIAP